MNDVDACSAQNLGFDDRGACPCIGTRCIVSAAGYTEVPKTKSRSMTLFVRHAGEITIKPGLDWY
jgi:hypothetical protein